MYCIHSFYMYLVKTIHLKHVFNRIKSHAASKYGLASQPRLVDIIAAVPVSYKKVQSTVNSRELKQATFLTTRTSVDHE